MTLAAGVNETGHFFWSVNNSTYRANYNAPILLMANAGNDTFDPEWNVYDTGSNGTVRIIVNNPTTAAHPMHLHGHNFYVLDEGPGTYDGHTIINPQNPQRRDVQLVRKNGYIVLQFDAMNPGVWPFHCHIAWHVSQGLYVNILERPADVRKQSIPQSWSQTCKDWEAFTSREIVDQIDSGL